jgi:hypothetical protein
MRPPISPENDVLTSDSISAFMPAFLKAQAAFKPAIKDATNPHFKSKYVALDGVLEAVAKPLRDCGIAIVQQTDIEDAQTILITRLIHESGEWIAGRYPVHPVKADPQGEGSALTYARRYALMALVGIAPEDDDGNAATEAVTKPITEAQEATLRDTLAASGRDEKGCCAYFGVAKLSELPAAKYDVALKMASAKKAA